MILHSLLEFFERTAPLSLQAEWDNSGLLVGDREADIGKVLVCLDVTASEVELAEKIGAELLVSHHPVIFNAKKKFTAGDVPFEAARHGINIVSLHTNLDKAAGGVNDTLCEILGLRFEKVPAPDCEGFLNIAFPEKEIEVSEFARLIKEKLGGTVQYAEGGNAVSKIGICSGAGADFINDALRFDCDAYVTGEASYHEFLDAKAMGISLFTAGHFETEIPIVKVLAEKIRNEFKDIEVIEAPSVSVIKTEK